MKSRLRSRSSEMNIDYSSQKLVTNKIFTLKKIEEFTSENQMKEKTIYLLI